MTEAGRGSAAPRGRLLIGIVGAGTMGVGIAQVALEAGHEVVVHDVDEAALELGRARIREGLGRRATKLPLDADSIDDWVDGRLANLREVVTLDALAAEADVVIEAALEDLELKRTIFAALDRDTDPATILATNTSALSIDDIAAIAERPERVVGLHFFNPAPLMPLVEVVRGRRTSARVLRAAEELVSSWGKTAVSSANAPGFIVNRVNRAFTLEALAALEAGTAGVESIDGAVSEAGFPLGPFELMDLTGIDISLATATSIFDAFRGRGDPLADRFRPSPTQERLVAEGRLGRKTGTGFYDYEGGRRTGPAAEFRASAGADGDDLPVGAVAARIRLAIDLEAWRARDDGVAAEADIDLALRLGASHPQGPFEHVAALGGPAALLAAVEPLAGLGPRFAMPPSLRGGLPTIER